MMTPFYMKEYTASKQSPEITSSFDPRVLDLSSAATIFSLNVASYVAKPLLSVSDIAESMSVSIFCKSEPTEPVLRVGTCPMVVVKELTKSCTGRFSLLPQVWAVLIPTGCHYKYR